MTILPNFTAALQKSQHLPFGFPPPMSIGALAWSHCCGLLLRLPRIHINQGRIWSSYQPTMGLNKAFHRSGVPCNFSPPPQALQPNLCRLSFKSWCSLWAVQYQYLHDIDYKQTNLTWSVLVGAECNSSHVEPHEHVNTLRFTSSLDTKQRVFHTLSAHLRSRPPKIRLLNFTCSETSWDFSSNPPTPLLWLRGRRKGSVKHWLPCLLAISPTWQASSHVPIPIFVCSGFESRKPLRCVRARPSIRHVPTCWGSAVLPLAVRATKAYRWAISPTPHACFASNHVPNQCLPKLRAAPIHLCF